MNQQEIQHFVERYLEAHESTFVEKQDTYLTVTLPKEVDKDLGNRPFYWTYCERMGIEPVPITLTFIFDREQVPDHIQGEWVGFGTRRLRQIFQSAVKHGKFVRLYEDDGNSRFDTVPLVPWLGINYRVEFICDQKRDLILSPGINLISGNIVPSFLDKIRSLPLSARLPDYRFTMEPIFSVNSAVSRVEHWIQQMIEREDRNWAERARERLQEELSLLSAYYGSEQKEEDRENVASEYEKRVEELKWQFEPRIEVKLINAGLFYLHSSFPS
ncbi:MAG: hypothetical protein H0Z33_05155 [Bacillaceae bacterium]|nr:hypothetical protein [Bacillaceae bacterium]